MACLSSKTAWSDRPPKSLQTLAEQDFHALGDEILVKELSRILGGSLDHVGEILDLIRHGVVERHRMQFAGVFDGQDILHSLRLRFREICSLQ